MPVPLSSPIGPALPPPPRWIQLNNQGKEGRKKNIRGLVVVVRAKADTFQGSLDDGNAGPIVAYGTIA